MNKLNSTIRYAAISLVLVLTPATSMALSIGEITLNSSYARALEATISIPAYSREELDTLTVNLASPADFEQAGLQWRSHFREITLKLRFGNDSKPFILLQSPHPINDLTLSLLLEFNWSGGKTLKQFNMLLSPSLPAKKTPEPQSLKSPETDIALILEQQTVPAPVASPAMVRPQGKLSRKPNGDYEYGPVLPGETLSTVAEKLSDKTSFSFTQRMNALFQLNRHAFAGDKPGRLKAGYYLTFSETAPFPPAIERQPQYEDNADSPRATGQVVRLHEIPGSYREVEHLEERLQKTREIVAGYRKSNSNLRVRLLELEKTLSQQAVELGIISQEDMLTPPPAPSP